MAHSNNTADRPTPLHSLRREWVLVAGVWLLVWLVAYGLLRPVWPYSERWFLLSGLLSAYSLWWVLWRNLGDNHPPDSAELLPSLGPGNFLTLIRGLCIALIGGFLFGPWPMGALAWIIVLIYTTADVADYFDGYLARRSNHVTQLGSRLDIEFDGLGTLVVILLAISFGQLPWWYLIIGLARYLFVFGLWLRTKRGLPIHDLPPSIHRRIFAGFQMGFLSVVLWPIVPAGAATIAGTLFALATGAGFLRDWLVVSGVVDPTQSAYLRTQQAVYRFFAVWLPPLLRALLAVSMIRIMSASTPTLRPAAWEELLASWHVPGPAVLATGLAILGIVGTVLITLGIAGRLVSIAMAFPIGFDISVRGLNWDNAVALVAIIGIMLLGTGPFSLWRPEDPRMQQRLGDK
ncbi:MAG: CDP-alcohol phosphatidyltransferase family protein [Chloroflexota bacterium]